MAANLKPAHKDQDQVAAKIAAIAEAWRGTDNLEGLFKVDKLIDLLTDQIVEMGGGSLAEQHAAIEAGTFQPSLRWAHAVRLATVLVVLIHVPLRVETLIQLTREMWKSQHVGILVMAPGAPAPWKGAIRLDIPADVMKGHRPFRPFLIKPHQVEAAGQLGSEPHERGIRRALLRLWFCPGGGREVVIRWPVRGHEPVDPAAVPWLFPGRPQKGKAERAPATTKRSRRSTHAPRQWQPGRISAAFRDAVQRYAVSLNVDFARLREIQGATGAHVVRKLYGSYWAPRNLLHCSRMLHHKNTEITASHYCALDEGAIDLHLGSEIVRVHAVRAAVDGDLVEGRAVQDAALAIIASLQRRVQELETSAQGRAA
jgi:hypothetical protein